MSEKVYVAIPLGDPAGVGPEIVVKALKNQNIIKTTKPVVIGDEIVIKRALDVTGLDFKINPIENIDEGIYDENHLNLINMNAIKDYEYGKVDANCAKAAYAYIKKAYDLCSCKTINAMATTPINKESFEQAKIKQIGHTGILENLSGKKDLLTMFEVKNLRVFFYSKHVSLRKACDLIEKDKIKEYVKKSMAALERIGIENPRFAVAGLNPHCGEHGLFGDEEVRHVIPAVNELVAEGFDVKGPIGADSVFYQALEGRFDGVLSLYHDQGHIATKMVDFHRTISITHNLDFLRTSVDHGTAFDIAGKNIANEVSMVEAIRLAVKYAPFFRR